ncbi:morphogenesis-related MSB1 [Fusarium mundagurra]|uniref:Morphogenesis-related MSB1 n=1 Tax=Fusarium mundagurra TaxID=1567541 RepID=A0A8H6DLQ2_9HYPO|nr:morphogenesis-related MSB1 [Fusarium mundagurra]
MAGLFSRLKGKDGKSKKKGANDSTQQLPQKPQWTDAWARTYVEPEEVHELIRCCTEELKARGLDHPFLLLPYRPTSDPSAVRSFIRHFFESHANLRGEQLTQELRMTEPMVVSGVAKWCWSRIQGGIVGWDAYELFKVGEIDSNMARDSFKTFIPISVENGARQRIIFDFFDLLAAVAAHGKSNGLGGRKLSRMAAWWAFEHKDTNKGFEGGYDAWLRAADATSHMFFAFLRSLSPEQNVTGITMLPRSLQKLLQETEYPPQRPSLMMSTTNKVVMIVDTVSPTPFALLRRANHFQYRDSDRALQEFSEYEDPVQALTDECRRVLKAISGANQSQASSSKHSTSLRDASWSRFEDIGFSSTLDEDDDDDDSALTYKRQPPALRRTPASGNGLGRPTTPSWADFLSSGFVDENQPARSNLLLPPDKVLPPLETQRQHSSQSHRPRLEHDHSLEPGELASIATFLLDDSFWWVWMSSLAPEETAERKSAFGRCAVIETKITSGRWLVMEEMVAGAAPEPQEGAYIAEKKGLFSWTKRGKGLGRRKSTANKSVENIGQGTSKASIGPDTHARIQAKAAQLRAQEQQGKKLAQQPLYQRRGRTDAELMAEKTNSVLTLQPTIIGEASSALKWVSKYDKGTIKDLYMANNNAGRGTMVSPIPSESMNGDAASNSGTQAPDQPPRVPVKDVVSPITSPTFSPTSNETTRKPLPQPEHPVQDQPQPEPVQAPTPEPVSEPVQEPTPEPVLPVSPLSPAPPPKDEAPHDSARENMVSPTPSSPENKKKKKLQKAEKENRGFRKLFRKNRSSKLPDDAAANVHEFLRQTQATPEPQAQKPLTPADTPEPAAAIQRVPVPQPVQADEADMPTPTPAAEFVTPMEEPVQRVDTPQKNQDIAEPTIDQSQIALSAKDSAPAQKAVPQFNQGPLEDQPAFAPDSDDENDATPPPIPRSPRHSPQIGGPAQPEEKLSHSAGPGVQDRWAQIRKNAAERAATRPDDQLRPSYSNSNRTGDGDDDTSGEETIESRVARIKARVAELTNNMEGTNGPQANATRH